ncbi:MAG: transporter substrate-binding domain-containing protein [Alphaproteobacteria bacterium]|nr:transporter substrate-binding domain-containing protein [Alphaproteobacteria bacterium]
MKALLTISTLFCLSLASVATAQNYPYADSITYTVEPISNVRVMPLTPENTMQPRGYHYGEAPMQPIPPMVQGVKEVPDISYLSYIRSRGVLRCGTNTQLKSFARLEDGIWYGIDADICKAIAIAVLGDSEKIEMVNVDASNVGKALSIGKIDVMLSGVPFKAAQEINGSVENAGLLYYDQQLLMVADEDKEPEFYRGKKICLASGSDYYRNFEKFNMEHNLDVSYLTFTDMAKVREAFLLKRCQMVTAGALFLSGMKQSMLKSETKIYPDQIAITPVYALVRSNNEEFRLAVKWILNALLLAEQYGINAQNINFFISHNNPEIRNLMGDNPELWQNLGLRSVWVTDAVKLLGNYGEIYDRNIGADSEYKIDRNQGRLLKDGGIVYPLPFM